MKKKISHWFFLFTLTASAFLNGSYSLKFTPKQNNIWENLPRPLLKGGVISQIIVDPLDADHLYALQEQTDEWQTITESIDSGDHWKAIANLQHIWLKYILLDPLQSNLLYAGSGTGIYRSENGGFDWIKIANWGPIVVISSNGVLYSIQNLQGIPSCPVGQTKFARSNDQGTTWEIYNLRCGIYGEISSSKSNPNIIYIREVDPASYDIQYLVSSVDGGITWTYLPLMGSFFTRGLFPVFIDPDNPKKLYSSSGTGIIISLNGGKTWRLRLDIMIPGTFLFSFTNNEIYAGFQSALVGALGAIFKSNDGGRTWIQLPEQLPTNLLVLVTSLEMPIQIYIGLDGYGIERSSNYGQTWRSINEGLFSSTKTTRLEISSDQFHQILAITDWPHPAIFKSNNDGISWSLPLLESDIADAVGNPRNSNIIWAVGNGGWVETKDGGNNWVSVSSLAGTNLSVSPNEPDRPCANHTAQGEGFLVCRNLDQNGQETWEAYSVPDSKTLSRVIISPDNASLIFVGGTPDYQVGTIYKSEDGGRNWKEILRSRPNYLLFDLAVSTDTPAKIIAVFGQYQLDNLLVYESLDTGNSWSDITSDIVSIVGPLSTGFTYRAFVFFDVSGGIYLATGDIVVAQLTPFNTWELYGAIDDWILTASIRSGPSGFLLLSGEKSNWKYSIHLQFSIWLPLLVR